MRSHQARQQRPLPVPVAPNFGLQCDQRPTFTKVPSVNLRISSAPATRIAHQENERSALDAIRQLLTRLGELAAHPGASGILVAYAVLWFIFDRESLDWHATTTLIVWFMTLLIQRADPRDTQPCRQRWTNCCMLMLEQTIQ